MKSGDSYLLINKAVESIEHLKKNSDQNLTSMSHKQKHKHLEWPGTGRRYFDQQLRHGKAREFVAAEFPGRRLRLP